MPANRFMRRVANTLRHITWLMPLAQSVWRIGQARYTVGAVAVILNSDRNILLVEHVFHPEIPWGLPGGWVGRNETPDVAILREIHEELGLAIELKKQLLFEVERKGHYNLAYLCKPLGEIGTLSPELLSYRWVDYLDLPTLYPFHYRAIAQAIQSARQPEDHQA